MIAIGLVIAMLCSIALMVIFDACDYFTNVISNGSTKPDNHHHRCS